MQGANDSNDIHLRPRLLALLAARSRNQRHGKLHPAACAQCISCNPCRQSSTKLFTRDKRPCKTSSCPLSTCNHVQFQQLSPHGVVEHPSEVLGKDARPICGTENWTKARQGTGAQEESRGPLLIKGCLRRKAVRSILEPRPCCQNSGEVARQCVR